MGTGFLKILNTDFLTLKNPVGGKKWEISLGVVHKGNIFLVL